MSVLDLSVVSPCDARAQRQLDGLLASAGIKRDAHLDYTVGLFNDEGQMLATGSLFGNTLRCFAVDERYRGQGLLGQILTFLVEREVERGYADVFLYTKPESATFFRDSGFTEIARVPGKLVFMCNRANAFAAYLNRLQRNALVPGRACAVVMNANPFTLGHLHLLERASKENDVVHVFVVSEDHSLFSFQDRFRLVKEGTAHLYKVMCHPSGSYIVSSNTFPSYFLKQTDDSTDIQARLDIEVFVKIAQALHITRRYIGEEPFSEITQIYNRAMLDLLPPKGVEVCVVPRMEYRHMPVSASTVRQYIHDGQIEMTQPLVPPSTYGFLTSEEGKRTVERIQRCEHVRHA